jgi:hypothetical protein
LFSDEKCSELNCLVELSKKSQQENIVSTVQDRDRDRDKERENNSDFNFAEFVRLKNENRQLKTQLAAGGSIPHPVPAAARHKSPMLPSIHASNGSSTHNSGVNIAKR